MATKLARVTQLRDRVLDFLGTIQPTRFGVYDMHGNVSGDLPRHVYPNYVRPV